MRKKTALEKKLRIKNRKVIDRDLERFVRAERTAAPASIPRLELADIQKAMSKFDRTGTADVVVGKHYGVAVKDEGDFISVRFGSNELTEIGSVPTGERNFATRNEAFDFAKQIQKRIRETISQCSLETPSAQGNRL